MISPTLRARRGYFAAAAGVVLLDQASKVAAEHFLRGRGPVAVVPGFFNLSYSRNPGGLFGYFGTMPDPWRTLLLTLFPLAAIVAIALFLARTADANRPTLCGLGMILGGAVGNLVDRVLRGEVVDFLDAYASPRPIAEWLVDKFGTAHWPTFNLADSAIVVGAGLLLLDVFRPQRAPAAEKSASREPSGIPPEPRDGTPGA